MLRKYKRERIIDELQVLNNSYKRHSEYLEELTDELFEIKENREDYIQNINEKGCTTEYEIEILNELDNKEDDILSQLTYTKYIIDDISYLINHYLKELYKISGGI